MARSESPIIIPQQTKLPLTKGEVTVLRAHLEDWRSVKAPTWEKVILKSRKKTYKEWLFNQCRWKGVPKPLIKYCRRWTGHRVLVQQNKARIREQTGETPGSLSAEEKEEANAIAEKWNNEAAPPEIQANVTETKGADMIEHFATEMFKQAGMRVFVLLAWQDGRGKLMVGGHDFNDQFGGANSFLKTRDWEGIFMPEWQEYAGEQFDTTEDQDVPQIVMSKKRGPQKLIELEEDSDGWPMLPETASWKCGDQQHVIRSFLIRHYRMCIGMEKVKVVVSWGDVVKHQSDFFDSTYWPANVQLLEPSKMDKADTTALLYFWHDRQQKNICPTFCFKAWKDSDGDMEKPSKSFLKAATNAKKAQHDKSMDEEEDQIEEHRSSANDDEDELCFADDPDPRLPAQVTCTRHRVTTQVFELDNTNGNATPPAKSKAAVVLPKTSKPPPKAVGAQTRSKDRGVEIVNNQPKAAKCRAADPTEWEVITFPSNENNLAATPSVI
ncbi:hypothetical protein F4604DRAFT_1925832 [Suillus subluteus]|nr:hypothetical protein F4604DRAFT_1925832 [Suillus subluteus]